MAIQRNKFWVLRSAREVGKRFRL